MIFKETQGLKKFMLQEERSLIISELSIVDYVMISIDKDKTVINSIREVYKRYSKYNIYFANGGDQNNNSIQRV